MNTPIDWNQHIAARNAELVRSRLRRTLAARSEAEEEDSFAPNLWWRKVQSRGFRDLKDGGTQAVDLIGDALPEPS